MEIFGIGPFEFLLILVIALIVVGPERLPEVARSIGKWVRYLRNLSSVVSAEWQRELSEATGTDVNPHKIQQAISELTNPLAAAGSQVQQSLSGPLATTQAEMQQARSDLQRALNLSPEPTRPASSPAPSESQAAVAPGAPTTDADGTDVASSAAPAEASLEPTPMPEPAGSSDTIAAEGSPPSAVGPSEADLSG